MSEPRRALAVAGLVLAAGMSRRMGESNKLLAEVDGKPMIAHVVDALLGSQARPIIVVLGHEAEKVRHALGDRDILFVHNPDYAEGLSTSLRRGLSALPMNMNGVVVCLGDMPRVRSTQIDSLIEAFLAEGGGVICVPVVAGKRGNPVLLPRRLFDEAKKVEGDVGARDVLERHADLVKAVDMVGAAPFLDVDSPEDLAALKEEG